MSSSYLIRNALLVDGSGASPGKGDVMVAGERIAAIAPHLDAAADRVVEADGLVVAPGFIDIHSHTDMTLFRNHLAPSKVFQGVAVEVVGNCGLGMFPVAAGREQELAEYLQLHDFALPEEGFGWRDFASCADRLDRLGLVCHVAPLVGHAPLRIAVMGMTDREPVGAELETMGRFLDEALRQGGWGMSTGLVYPPGSYASTAELIALARILAASGALYASHVRNEGKGLMASLNEAIAIGRESGARVQVSHLKALGKNSRGKGKEILARLAEGRAAGVDVGADQYPYDASATTLAAVVPAWAHAGGVPALLRRLRDPGLRARLAAEIRREMAAREGATGIVVSNIPSAGTRGFSGRTVAAIAANWGCSPENAVIRLLLEEEGRVGAIFFSMAEEDVATIVADPQVAVGSDGHALDAVADAGEATHPRSYGTFPRVLRRYVREEKLLSLAAAIRKMTALPAARLGLADRGLVRPGFAADLVLFDPEAIADRATYADPHRYATGIVHLLVAGRPVIWDGKLTGERPGRVLRRPRS